MDPQLEYLIRALDLRPHPEGGYYVETWRGEGEPRGCGTAIYYLMTNDRWQRWHKVDAVEIWHVYAGAPVELELQPASTQGEAEVGAEGASPRTRVVLSSRHEEMQQGARPQAIVPKGAWQRARSTGPWSLCGCTVTPAFEFSTFEILDLDQEP